MIVRIANKDFSKTSLVNRGVQAVRKASFAQVPEHSCLKIVQLELIRRVLRIFFLFLTENYDSENFFNSYQPLERATNRDWCKPCPKYFSCPEKSESLSPCENGTYGPTKSLTECKICQLGHFCIQNVTKSGILTSWMYLLWFRI